MKINTFQRLAWVLTVSLLVVMSTYTQNVYAATSQIYTSPAGGSFTAGQTISLSVRVNAQATVNAVQANISYPADKIEVASISYSGGAFDIQAESSSGGGSIPVGRGTITSFTGDRLVATISFTVKSNSGSAAVTFTSGTLIANNGAEVTSTKSSGSYTFYAPAPPPVNSTPSTTKPSTSNSTKTTQPAAQTTPTVSPTTEPPKDTKKPTINKVSTDGKLAKLALVITADENVKLALEYGLTTSYGLTAYTNALNKDSSINLDTKYLLPKTTYHYKISATDASGNNTVTEDKTFTTPGLPAIISVSGSDNKPLAGAKVTIDGETKTTDKNGKVSFDLGIGQKTATIQFGDKTALKTFVLGSQTSDNEPLNVMANIDAKAQPPYKIIIGTLGLGLLLVAIAYLLNKKMHLVSRLRLIRRNRTSPANEMQVDEQKPQMDHREPVIPTPPIASVPLTAEETSGNMSVVEESTAYGSKPEAATEQNNVIQEPTPTPAISNENSTPILSAQPTPEPSAPESTVQSQPVTPAQENPTPKLTSATANMTQPPVDLEKSIRANEISL